MVERVRVLPLANDRVLLGIDEADVFGSAEKVESKASAESHGASEAGNERVGRWIAEPVCLDTSRLEVHVLGRHTTTLRHRGPV